MIRASLVVLFFWTAPAFAMNWEGHDDWMADDAAAAVLEENAPHARPLPRRDCPVTEEEARANPYEQIPLPHHNCASRHEKAVPRN